MNQFKRRRYQLSLEALEDRLAPANVFVVPVSQASDVTHLYTLADAAAAAGAGGVVTIEPGASPDLNQPVVVTQNGITIQGDPNVPGSILPAYDLKVLTSHVTLTNLNLASVQFGNLPGDSTAAFNTVSKCVIGQVIEYGFVLTLTQNTITGNAKFAADYTHGAGQIITNNTFTSIAPMILEVDYSLGATGTVISQNTFYGNTFGQVAIDLFNCQNACVVANNVISLTGDSSTGIRVQQTGDNFSSVRIQNNQIDTHRVSGGIGIDMMVFRGDLNHSVALLEGNDFHNNAVGVALFGNSQDLNGLGAIDMGGGPLGSRGGNSFRGFTSAATIDAAAIVVSHSRTDVVSAQQNMFTAGVVPASVVFMDQGFIDLLNPLTSQQSFVQALYNEVLGRTGILAELNAWVSVLNAQGRGAVANGILHSNEALGRIVDQLYLRFLGRQSDAAGRDGWIRFLQNGGTEEQVETLFLTSSEYISHINVDYVQSLYMNILGRTASGQELAQWNNNIQNLGGLSGVANAFTRSSENRLNTLRMDFQTFLHRTPADSELTPLVNTSLDLLSLESAVLSSAEFFSNG
jgi:hypothetical protein